jgi:hypothetical protein
MEEKMKLLKSIFGVFMAIAITGIFAGCATTSKPAKVKVRAQQDLTQATIIEDIGDISGLIASQYFLSKEIQLHWTNIERTPTGIKSGGKVNVLNTIKYDDVRIRGSSKGILYTYAATGTIDDVLRQQQSSDGDDLLILGIIFGKNNDEYLEFATYADDPSEKFELVIDSNHQVMLGGQKYTVSYEGNELPYLKYNLVEREVVQTTKRTFSGRNPGK